MDDAGRATECSLTAWRCKECGSPLMGTKSGSVCPNGHGYLLPKMPPAVRRINHAVLLGIQRITNRWGHFYLDNGREVEIVRQVSREIRQSELHCHALDGHRLVKIRIKEAADA